MHWQEASDGGGAFGKHRLLHHWEKQEFPGLRVRCEPLTLYFARAGQSGLHGSPKPDVEPVQVTLALRNTSSRLLRPEREAGLEGPPPFAEKISAWERGEWPQSLSSTASHETWAGQMPIRFV